MNFEFKSTFKILITPFAKTKQLLLQRRKTFYGYLILSMNSLGMLIAGLLYLNNYIIPATIGSRSHGALYIYLLELSGWLVLASSCLGLVLSISHRLPKTYLDIPFILIHGICDAARWFKKQFIKVYLVINLLKPFRESQERALLNLIRLHYPAWCWPASAFLPD